MGHLKKELNASINGKDKEKEVAKERESTAQWVNRAFGANNNTTNEGNATSINKDLQCDDLDRFVTTN